MIAHRSNDFFDKFLQDEIFARFTAATKQAIAVAENSAPKTNAHDHVSHQHNPAIDTHHLLLGLMSDRVDLVAQALRSRAVTLPKVQYEIEQLFLKPKRIYSDSSAFRIKQSLQFALEASIEMGHCTIDTGHLLLGLIRQGYGQQNQVTQLLANLGVDLQKLDQQIQEHLRDVQLARMNGIYLSPAAGTLSSYYPADIVAGEIAACLTAWLVCWVDPSKLGRVFTNTGFQLPNHDIQALGISFISETRLEDGSNYLRIAPDLVIEIKSTKESLISLQVGIEQMLELGTRIGIVINPEEQTVILYRPNDDITLLKSTDIIEIPDVLPGWKLAVSSIWVSEPNQNRFNPSLKAGVE